MCRPSQPLDGLFKCCCLRNSSSSAQRFCGYCFEYLEKCIGRRRLRVSQFAQHKWKAACSCAARVSTEYRETRLAFAYWRKSRSSRVDGQSERAKCENLSECIDYRPNAPAVQTDAIYGGYFFESRITRGSESFLDWNIRRVSFPQPVVLTCSSARRHFFKFDGCRRQLGRGIPRPSPWEWM
jgi:hypothetical protein